MPALNDTELARLSPTDRALYHSMVAKCWETGHLADLLLDPTQLRMRAKREAAWASIAAPDRPLTQAEMLIRASKPISFFELACRETGKSFDFLTLVQETMRQKPGALVVVVRGRAMDAEKVARDLMPHVEASCPQALRLAWKPGDGEYHHPTNGSICRFRGTEAEQHSRLRGSGYDLAIFDEVAEIDNLDVVMGIVEPIVLRLNGKIILATTPAETEDHISQRVYEEFARRGASCEFTLLDHGRLSWEEKAKRLLSGLTPESIEDVPDILAGKKRCKITKNRREWFCEFLAEGSVLVHPPWPDLAAELTVRVER